MRQQALTVLCEINNGQVDALRESLAKVREEVKAEIQSLKEGQTPAPNPTYIRFEDTGTHFARWVVLDNDPTYPPMLVFSSNHDGPLDEYIERLLAAGPGLDEIWSKCKGYPGSGTSDPAAFRQFIRANAYPYSTFYVAYPTITRESARNALDLQKRIECFLDEERQSPRFDELSPSEIVAKINQFVAYNQLEVLPGSMPRSNLVFRFLDFTVRASARTQRMILIPLLILLSPILIPLALLAAIPVSIFLWQLRRHEKREGAEYRRTHVGSYIPSELVLKQENQEDVEAQNQMTHLVPLTAGRFRLLAASLFMGVIQIAGKYIFTQGALGDITTVQFARWVYMNDRRRLLFFSNFDGSWQNYMGDFVDRVPWALTGIWTNTIRFPPTRFLLADGAADLDGFMQFIREFQVPSDVWYTSYPEHTGRNIVNAIRIRDKLGKKMNEQEQIEWLRRF